MYNVDETIDRVYSPMLITFIIHDRYITVKIM